MNLSYKYRIYPNKFQKQLINKTFGCVRFVYNYYLNKRIKAYESDKITLNFYDCCKDLTQLKCELSWLREPDKCALQNTLRDLNYAYEKFFNEHIGYPKFKTKKSHRFSYRTQNGNGYTQIKYENRRIKLPKLGWIVTKDRRIPNGTILNATISKNPSGKYFVSLCCKDVGTKSLPKTDSYIGIDLGIKHIVTTSNGVKYDNPRCLENSLAKLAKLQRGLSRKSIDGSNWNKARIKVARLYEKIHNRRIDYLHKLSTDIVRNNDVICIEDLSVDRMIQNGTTTMRIGFEDISLHEFVRQLKYKAELYERTIVVIPKNFPSSQLCNCCGFKNTEMAELNRRQFICPKCGIHIDRDINAAINIKKIGIQQIL